MNSTWQTFLEQQGAHLENGIATDFGDAPAERLAARDAAILCDLSQFGLLRVSGDDAQTFLQNMLSSDVREVGSRAQYSSLSTPKGRMLATFLIWRNGGDYFLQLARDLVPAIHKKLAMYVLRSKVKVSDASDEFVCLGYTGPLTDAPDAAMGATATDAGFCLRLDSQRRLLAMPAANAPAVWQKLAQQARPAGSPCWDWLAIQAGIPTVCAPTQEQFVPQMGNLEVIGGVNFKKGCYPGQEIVARMQYLGKAKRRMYLAHCDQPARPGERLFSASPGENAHGLVVNAAPAPEGGYDLLGVLPIASFEHGDIRLGDADGAPLDFLPLPYALP